MKLVPLEIEGAFVVEPEPIADERGYFARTFDREVFLAAGLAHDFTEWSVSHNRKRGTLRGMHYQAAPWEETKIVGCAHGALYDVIVDARPESPTFNRWAAVELRAPSPRLVYIPAGVAHGFQALEDDTVVSYHISGAFHPEAARGLRWDDEAFAISWPLAVTCISERDRTFALQRGREK